MHYLSAAIPTLSLLLVSLFSAPLWAEPAEIYLMRHAEKQQSIDKDPALTDCGLAQAEAMARLISSPLAVIFHSGYQRTLQTAQQVAKVQTNAGLKAYDATDLTGLVAHIKQQQHPVLIVGHSNTTPALIELLSQSKGPTITEQDFGVVYQLKKTEQGYNWRALPIQTPTICLPSST